MTAQPAGPESEQPADQILLSRLKQAAENGDIEIIVKAASLAGPSSPLFRWGDAVAVAGVGLVLAILPGYVEGIGWSPPVLVGWAILMVFWIRWYLQRIRVRAIGAGLQSVALWDSLWRRGGVVLRADGESASRPGGQTEWRAFVRKHVLNQL